MVQTSNSWIKYITRSQEQIVQEIVDKVKSGPSAIPELSDITEADDFYKMISMWGAISDMVGYYIDNKAENIFEATVNIFVDSVNLAESRDYRVKSYNPASVNIKFTINQVSTSEIIIPINTEVRVPDGSIFFTIEQVIIPIGELEITVDAIQRILNESISIGTTTGLADQEVEIDGNIVDSSISILIDGNNYIGVDTFAFSLSSDFHFIGRINNLSNFEVVFGDGRSGFLPGINLPITATYYTTDGLNGNVRPNAITEIVTSLTLPVGITIEVTNINQASGGTSFEGITAISKGIISLVRTKDNAINKSDFEDIANQVNGVESAKAEKISQFEFDINVIPSGGGIATQLLLTSVDTYISERKTILIDTNINITGTVRSIFTVGLNILPGYILDNVFSDLQSNIILYFENNRSIKGVYYFSDLYRFVEVETVGLNNWTIQSIELIPYPVPVSPNNNELIHVVNSVNYPTVINTVTLEKISATQFAASLNGGFNGNYNFDEDVLVANIININVSSNAYDVGVKWKMIIYPLLSLGLGNITLIDNSYIFTNTNSITK